MLNDTNTTNLLDDILVVASHDADHNRKLDVVLQWLSEHRSTSNLEKALFGVDELHFIGITESKDCMRSLESKVASQLDFPPQTSTNSSTANYYMEFGAKFAEFAAQLPRLLRYDVNWNSTSECNSVIEQINSEIASSRVTGHFEANLKSIVSSEESAVALAA